MVRFRWLALFLATLLPALAFGQDNEPAAGPHEAVVQEMLSVLEQITEALKTVQDKDTAAAAQMVLQKVAAQWQQVRKKADALRPPSKEEREKLEGYAKKFTVAQKQLFAQMSRVISVEGGREALREVRAVLTPPDKSKTP
jgi:hypothetical protein